MNLAAMMQMDKLLSLRSMLNPSQVSSLQGSDCSSVSSSSSNGSSSSPTNIKVPAPLFFYPRTNSPSAFSKAKASTQSALSQWQQQMEAYLQHLSSASPSSSPPSPCISSSDNEPMPSRLSVNTASSPRSSSASSSSGDDSSRADVVSPLSVDSLGHDAVMSSSPTHHSSSRRTSPKHREATTFLYSAATNRRVKDRRAPKNPRSAYVFFVAEQRQNMAKNGDLDRHSFTDVAVLVGKQWRTLAPELKRPYELKARADKERYLQEKRRFMMKYRS